ncbi:MAG TPA: hypothetical protein VLL25_11350, partial [Acidimicrobiales bacterium]|nr:hypothetical protein [Acidimicrobiales bacterium]
LDLGSQTAKEGKGVSGVAVALVATGGLAVAGLPLFGTALGKGIIEDAARAAGYGWVIPVVVVASGLTGAAVLLIAWAAFDEGRGGAGLAGELVAVSAALLSVGVGAGFALTGWAMAVATRFVNTTSYQHVVLDNGFQGAVRSAGSVGLTGGGLGLDLLGVAGALTLAFVLRGSERRQGATWSESSRLAAVRGVLWRLHNGSIGDSAAWVTVGVAGVGVVLALGLH